jgi:hypothetical protein
MRNACKILFRNPKEKRRLGTPICRWEDNIKWILKILFIYLFQDRDKWQAVVNVVMNVKFCLLKLKAV